MNFLITKVRSARTPTSLYQELTVLFIFKLIYNKIKQLSLMMALIERCPNA